MKRTYRKFEENWKLIIGFIPMLKKEKESQ